jgi:hypothetical protein
MKKGLALAALVVATLSIFGCQQPKTQQQPAAQTETSTATIKISEGETATSKATLEIKGPTTQQATGTLTVLPSTEETKAPTKADTKVQ